MTQLQQFFSRSLRARSVGLIVLASWLGSAIIGCTPSNPVSSNSTTTNSTPVAATHFSPTKPSVIRLGYQKGGIIPISRQRGELERELTAQNIKTEWSGLFDRCASLLQAIMGDRTDRDLLRPRLPPANLPRWIISHRVELPFTLLQAAVMPNSSATATGQITTAAIAAPMNISIFCGRFGRATRHLITMASFINIKAAFSEVKPLQPPLPIYFGGASDAAIPVGAKHSHVYAMWGEPIAAVKQRIAEVKAAAPSGKHLRFSVSLRPILGDTEEKAWERARSILAKIESNRPAKSESPNSPAVVSARPQAVGSRRLLDFAQDREIFDKRLWTPIAAATGAYGNTTALVGTPEQVAESLIDYYDAGVTTLLIRGFDPLEDAIAYGRDVIPLVRAEVERRERQIVTMGG